MGVCSPAPPRSRIDSSGTHRTRGQVVGERRHPSPTTRHIRETRTETPAKVAISPIQANQLPCSPIYADTRRISRAPPPPQANVVGMLGFLGHLDDISLKIENVGHSFHLLSHLAAQTMGVCSPAPPRSRIDSSGTHRTRGQVVGERRHPSPTTRHIRETRTETPAKVAISPIQANQLPCSPIYADTRRISRAPPPPQANVVGMLGFLGHLDDISLKIENVGHGCHLLPWFSVFGLGSSPTVPRCCGGELVTRYDPDKVACFRAKL